MKLFTVALLAVLLLAPAVFYSSTGPVFALAQEEDDYDEDAVVVEDEDDYDEDAVVGGDDDEDEDLVGDALIGPSKDAVTFISFPYNKDHTFPAGSVATAFVGINNQGSEPFIISGIDGSLRQFDDYSQSYQNFTPMPYDIRVDAHTEATFEYKFRPAERFEPRDFALTISLHFHTADESVFINTVFNETVAVTDSESNFDWTQTLVYLGLAGAAVAFVMKKTNTSVSSITKSNKAPKAAAPVEAGDKTITAAENSFIQDFLKQNGGGQGKKKASKKKHK